MKIRIIWMITPCNRRPEKLVAPPYKNQGNTFIKKSLILCFNDLKKPLVGALG